MYAIQTKDLVKTYGTQNAVNHVNMNVPLGVAYGFVGPNGAGKTTTIGMIMSHKKVSQGSIEVLGKEIHFFDQDYKASIGYVSDVPEFYNWMNASEYLRFCGEIFSLSKEVIKQRTIELLELVGLSDVKKSIGTYSRGMRQRLAIAQALMHDPQIIIMDEPTSALDPLGRKEVMDIVLKLKGEKTIFYSTHILGDVERVCDYVGIINHGTLLIEDTISNLKQKYYQTKIVIETDQSFETMKSKLEPLEWCNTVYLSGMNTCISVSDEDVAMLELPKLIAKENWKLRKFNKEEQTLEDIFLKVVSGE